MVSVGSKALPSRSSMGSHDYESHKRSKSKKKPKKGGDTVAFHTHSHAHDHTDNKHRKNTFTSAPQASRIRYSLYSFPTSSSVPAFNSVCVQTLVSTLQETDRPRNNEILLRNR